MSINQLLVVILVVTSLTTCAKGQGQHKNAPRDDAGTVSPDGTPQGEEKEEGQKDQPPPPPPPHPLSVSITHAQIPGFALVRFDKIEIIQFNYTLQCDTPETIYTLVVKSTHPEVAKIVAGHAMNVTCENATFDTPVEDNNNNANDKNSNDNNNDKNTNHFTTHDMVVPTHDNNDHNNNNNNDNNIVVKSNGTALHQSSTSGSGGQVTGSFNVTFKGETIGRSFLLMFAIKVGRAPVAGTTTASGSIFTSYNVSSADDESAISVKVRPPGAIPPVAASSRPPQGSSGPSGPPQGPPQGGPPGMPPNTVFKGMLLVVKLPTIYDEMFRIASYVLIILATTGMGIKVRFDVIKAVLKRPLAPAIGLFSQYVCMPLIAYAVAKLVPQPSPAVALGIFTCGIVPGGGASNIYCYLLGGDVSLSVTMTTISSVCALGLIPFWLYTLGDTFQDEMSTVHVPFFKILETLAIVVLPIFLGMLIKYKLPKVAKVISKVLTLALLIVVIFFISVGIYLNFYIFEMIKPMQILAGCLLPYIGYLLGGVIALVFRRPWTIVKTIAIETGIQNVGIAFLILYLSLPPPDNVLSIVGPVASSLMTPLPLLLITIFYITYNKCLKRKHKEEADDKGTENGGDLVSGGEGRPATTDDDDDGSSRGKSKGLWDWLAQLCKDSEPSEAEASQEMIPKDSKIEDSVWTDSKIART